MDFLKKNLWLVGLIVVLSIWGLFSSGLVDTPPGLRFGLIDNGVVLLGMYLGVDLDGWLAARLGREANPLMAAVCGATCSNMLSDGVAAYMDSAMAGMEIGIILGCLIPILLIGFCERVRSLKK